MNYLIVYRYLQVIYECSFFFFQLTELFMFISCCCLLASQCLNLLCQINWLANYVKGGGVQNQGLTEMCLNCHSIRSSKDHPFQLFSFLFQRSRTGERDIHLVCMLVKLNQNIYTIFTSAKGEIYKCQETFTLDTTTTVHTQETTKKRKKKKKKN